MGLGAKVSAAYVGQVFNLPIGSCHLDPAIWILPFGSPWQVENLPHAVSVRGQALIRGISDAR